jgi:alpha-L-fucosidase 2
MGRSEITLPFDKKLDELPTDERLELLRKTGNDNGLITTYWDFSKYLMISGSFPGSLPLNLQGIWNKDPWPAWGGRFTVNINTEMNYWAAEAQGLHECVEPLFTHISRMTEHGRETARTMYGVKHGAVCHHNTDIWGDCAPQDRWMPGTLWPMGLAWLSLHIREHYLYSNDSGFLYENYHNMLEAAQFFREFLIVGKGGTLITSPSVSPENSYVIPGKLSEGAVLTDEQKQELGAGKADFAATLCEGPSMDSQILYELFTAVSEAADIVGEKELVPHLEMWQFSALRDRLPKPKIGKYGQICEWAEDYDEVEPGHRHISQLFALFPGSQIDPLTTPELAAAARATIERRLSHGGGHTGWSRAWLINMFARLSDGEKAYDSIVKLLQHSTSDNLFDMHPPFQIDGNFGGASGITECLVQSHGGKVRFLPALPKAWDSGEVKGIRLRGGFTLVKMTWEKGNFSARIDYTGAYTGGKPVNLSLYKGNFTEFSPDRKPDYTANDIVRFSADTDFSLNITGRLK